MDASSLLAFDTLAAETGAVLWPATVAINGSDLAATIVPPRSTDRLTDFANEPDESLIVRVSKSILPIAPAAHTHLTYAARRYKIRGVHGGAHDAQWTITCDPS